MWVCGVVGDGVVGDGGEGVGGGGNGNECFLAAVTQVFAQSIKCDEYFGGAITPSNRNVIAAMTRPKTKLSLRLDYYFFTHRSCS